MRNAGSLSHGNPSGARHLGDLWHNRDGTVAVILAAVLAGLVGGVALVFDLGRAWSLQGELQAAVDAAALAGAGQLDGASGARVRAVTAAAGALARNRQIFASDGGPGPVTFDTAFDCAGDGCILANDNFRFLASLTPRVDALSDTEARFIEMAVRRTVRFTFAGLIGATREASPGAAAIAAWDRLVCGRAALLVCNPDEPAGNRDVGLPFDAARHAGAGITLRDAGNGPLGPGRTAWLATVACDAATDTCMTDSSVAAVAEAIARVAEPEVCRDGAVPTAVSTAALADAINTRLDIYSGSTATLTDDPAFQPSPNFLTGLVPADGAVVGGAFAACDFPGALTIPANPFLGPGRHAPDGTAPLDHVGYPRDNCAYPRADGDAPADNCIAVPPEGGGIPPGRPVGTGVWDLPAYMTYHHPGIDLAGWSYNACPGAGCRLGGIDVDLDHDGRLSRWEVYTWELAGRPPRLDRPQCFGGGAGALPQAPFDPARIADRRLLGAVVANCAAIEAAFGGVPLDGSTPVPLAGGDRVINLFLSEAVGELAPNAIYAEIVTPAAIPAVAAVRPRDRIVLRE